MGVTWKRQVFPPSCGFQVSCLRGNQVQLGAGPPSRTGRFWQSQQMTPWHPSCALDKTLVVKPPTSLVPTCPNQKLLNPDLEGTIFTVPRIPSAWNCLNLPWHPVAIFYPMKVMGARCHRSSVNDVESKLPGYVSGIREWFRWCALSCHCW